SRAGNRLDLRDIGIARRLFLDPSGDELFDSFRTGAGPGYRRHCNPNLEHWVFALRHFQVAEDSPGARRNQEHPCNVACLDEIARSISYILDGLVVAFAV